MGIELLLVLSQSLAWFGAGAIGGTLWKEARFARIRE